ncbi:AMP-binding protein [Nocardiopsis xinjiangensis]|uniref:AMP-binding protein n=1 Tax=Nocardiopsis xinjiangensis TaxID=124285 RepID=UPI0003472942|nr:AMP-binding protein [Nocardiopsis xinjiangensis]
MTYIDMEPAKLLSLEFSSPEVADTAWHTRWDSLEDPEDLALSLLPPCVDFSTSGTTGPSQRWRRRRSKVWAEAGMLADLVRPQYPEAVVSFVPTLHLYGALTSVLLPAHLRLPTWYKSGFFGTMPDLGSARRAVVVATPWIFRLLLENLDWVRSLDQVTVLYGGAMIPDTANEFLREAGPERARIVEVLGSTEAGGIATRQWSTGEPPEWTLFPDVEFTESVTNSVSNGTESGELSLSVTSPRLAFREGEEPLESVTLDDFILPLGPRSFTFTGRSSRIVKVNGRRINLDEVENSLHSALDCEDLAFLPVTDSMIGEHIDMYVVLGSDQNLKEVGLEKAFARLGVRPRKVHTVPRINRSSLNKVRPVQ